MPLPAYLQPGGETPPGSSATTPHPTTPGGRPQRRTLLASAGAVCLAAAFLAGIQTFSTDHTSPQNESTPGAGSSLVLAAPPERNRAVCLDKSDSVDQDQQLATNAAGVLQSALAALYPPTISTPDWERVEPITGLNLFVRVVRANSYATQDADRYTIQATVPSTPGISTGMPTDTDDPDYTTDVNAWSQVYTAVRDARAATPDARADLAQRIGELDSMTSDGSDISGCVSAMLQVLQPLPGPKSYLVVTDCEDTLVTDTDGDPRQLDGHFDGPLTLILACPDGDPAHCEEVKQAFLARLTPLGLDPASVTVYRPEQVSFAIENWLRN